MDVLPIGLAPENLAFWDKFAFYKNELHHATLTSLPVIRGQCVIEVLPQRFSGTNGGG